MSLIKSGQMSHIMSIGHKFMILLSLGWIGLMNLKYCVKLMSILDISDQFYKGRSASSHLARARDVFFIFYQVKWPIVRP